jgi:hypothetical protein
MCVALCTERTCSLAIAGPVVLRALMNKRMLCVFLDCMCGDRLHRVGWPLLLVLWADVDVVA